MTTETATEPGIPSATDLTDPTERPTTPPTAPCSVVWCCGRPYVLEGRAGRARWVGNDDRGRPERLSNAELQRRGWSHRRAR
ncbi:hypothetical protein VSH64_13670 [Amycolatopsis rhabdoformis]|uniref:Uncharacterized protein n=1 Tax=Amycolatopsis rhabdoformis TaxID=1448059 RepID=A0ABZ1IHM2_9PSEU|nr:hypothetical protein [Amycolatopsis rhabdoformis]WSE33153.1 hypothetical protein VSH64_13670 [Amycolatopsis rhabdoformis]